MSLFEYVESKKQEHLNDLFELLRIPSISAQSQHKPDIERAAQWVAERLRRVGLDSVEILPTKMHPLVYGESLEAPGKPTILFYGHYDVQPADPLDLWTSPPFEPRVADGFIFARGAADNKGQILAHILGVEAALASGGLPVNVLFIVEGEEEIGSPNLDAVLSQHAKELSCDVVVISDSTMIAPGVPTFTYGLRGIGCVEVRVTGPAIDLHSGLYG